MAAIDFPNSPAPNNGDTYTPSNGITYIYQDGKWTAIGPVIATGPQGPQGEPGPAGADGAAGAKGDKGDKGDTGDTGPAGADGASGQGLINQTIILNSVAPSTSYVAQAVTEWSASYTGTGGQLLVTVDMTAWTGVSALRNWYLKKDGTTVATGTMYINTTSSHLTMPPLKYIDTSGSTTAATWSITLGTGLTADPSDRCTITVTEYTGIADISINSLTAPGNVSGSILISTNATANEGGEIQLATAPNSTLTGSDVVIDQYADRIRFFETGGTNRGAYIDLTQASASVGTLLNNRVSAVNLALNTALSFDNISVQIRTNGGGAWMYVNAVSGTPSWSYSLTYQIGAGADTTARGLTNTWTASTTPTILGSASYLFANAGSTLTTLITDLTANKMYRVTWMMTTGSSPWGNYVSIERLV